MPRLPSPVPSLRPALFAVLLALPFAAHAAEVPKHPAAAAAPAAAAPPAAGDASDPVVMKINGSDIRRSEIVTLQKSLGPQAANIPLDQFYQRVADRLIATKLIGEAAKAAKIDNDPDVKSELEKAKEQILTRVYVAHLQTKGETDDALKALYDKTVKSEAGKPEVHARHILVKTEEEAKAIITQLDQGGDFAKLADEKSTDKGGNGGDLGWFNKEQMVPEFSEAAFKLGKGEYTKEPVKTQFGYHVIKVEDTRVAAPPSFDEAKEKLKTQLASEIVDNKIKELRAKAKVEQFAIDGTPLPPAPAPGAAPTAAPAK